MPELFVVSMQAALAVWVAIAAVYYGTMTWWAIAGRPGEEEAH